jgi:pimeloyl-ACP methyl ester carboxylesterase
MREMKRLGRIVAIVMACLYVTAAAVLYGLQREFIFPGQHHKLTDSPISRVADAAAYRVHTSVGATDAWFLPPLVRPDGRTPVLIFGHGNGEVIDQWLGNLDEFRRWGFAVTLVEYPGYGRSEGAPSEAGIREAVVGAYDAVVNRPEVDRSRIVGYGQSLGGGAICALAGERPLAALVLQSTFTSLRIFAHQYFMPEFLIRDPFDNASVVRAFQGPVLVVHGRHDGLIPYQEGQQLATMAQKGTFHLYECGHWCWLPNDVPLLADMHNFFQASGILPRASVGATNTLEPAA